MPSRHEIRLAEAKQVVDAIAEELVDRDLGAAVAVVDNHGELVAFLKSDGCPLASINNAVNKAFTSAREGVPSRAIGESSRDEGFPLTNFGDPRYIGWGGGLPIIREGAVVGAVGVSGLSEDDDIALAQTGLDSLGA